MTDFVLLFGIAKISGDVPKINKMQQLLVVITLFVVVIQQPAVVLSPADDPRKSPMALPGGLFLFYSAAFLNVIAGIRNYLFTGLQSADYFNFAVALVARSDVNFDCLSVAYHHDILSFGGRDHR